MSKTAQALFSKVRRGEALIGVIGLGYVGLPLSIAFGEAETRVLGFDLDPVKSRQIAAGKSYIRHVAGERIAALVQRGLFSATADMGRLSEPDAILICVPTPLGRNFDPDLSFVASTCEAIARTLRPGQLIVLESTTYPGTTRELVQPILERNGLKAGVDFYLAFSPEREDPGNLDFTTARIPKVIGADDRESRALAIAVYERFAANLVPVSSSATAEAVKITENVFRAVNIALVNELKLIYGSMGVDIWEVIDAAKTKPFGFMPFYPGPGLGGHCVPIDPFYLAWKARERGMRTRFIELAGEINSAMPEHIVEVLAGALKERVGKGLDGSRILILGLAYKKNVDDTRESPSLRLIELIEARGAEAAYHDPFVPEIPLTREHADLAGRRSWAWDLEEIASYDAVLIATDHDGVDYRGLAERSRLIVDARNACARAGADLARVVPA
ncbi:MAG: nucleotide sugar dehydrogenase [Amphiplicatus sp.]